MDFERRTGKMSFHEFGQKNTLFGKTNYSMFHYSFNKRYWWAKNERNSNFEVVPQKVDFGRYLQTVALKNLQAEIWHLNTLQNKDLLFL